MVDGLEARWLLSSPESEEEWYAEDKCRGVIMEPISLEITTFARGACLIILAM